MCSGFSKGVMITSFISAVVVLLNIPIMFGVHAEEFVVNLSNEQTDKNASVKFNVEVLSNKEEMQVTKPRILIYHTHTFEAYEQNPLDRYAEIDKWRTKDSRYNVTAVGKALGACLESLGFDVVHDQSIFEPPTIDQAYDRSCKMLEERIKAGEQYDLIIDLHRDALSSQATIKRTVEISGTKTARFMVLIGKGSTGGYTLKPEWEKNMAIAQSITDHLNAQFDGLARDVKIKTGRFNQHISDRCILIECGMNTNTLDEVLAGIPYLADAIRKAIEQNEKNPPTDPTVIGGYYTFTVLQEKAGIRQAKL